MPQDMCGGQRTTCRNLLSPPTMWEIRFQSWQQVPAQDIFNFQAKTATQI